MLLTLAAVDSVQRRLDIISKSAFNHSPKINKMETLARRHSMMLKPRPSPLPTVEELYSSFSCTEEKEEEPSPVNAASHVPDRTVLGRRPRLARTDSIKPGELKKMLESAGTLVNESDS